MPASGAVTLGRVRGVPIRAHWTLLLLLPYLTFVFASRFTLVTRLSGVDPATVRIPPAAWGLLIAVGLFASIAVHELVHTLIAQHFGGRVKEITLMLLGGVSQVEHMPRRPSNEALMAFAGPAASLVLGGLLQLSLHAPLPPDVRLGAFYLGHLNLALGLFNLLPAFPMDGGRVLRALLAVRIGPLRATRAAAAVGRVSAVLLGLWGLWGGNFLLVFIALFLYAGADAERRAEEQRAALAGLRVADLASRSVPAVAADASVADAADQMRREGRLELVVVAEDGSPVGLLRARDLAEVPADTRASLRVRDLDLRLEGHAVAAAPDEPVTTALERAARAGGEYLVVVDAGRVVGLVGRRELETALALRALEERRRSRGVGLRPREA